MSYLVMGIATCVTGLFMFFTPPFKTERDVIQLAKKYKIVRKRYEKQLALRKQQKEQEEREMKQKKQEDDNGDNEEKETGVVIGDGDKGLAESESPSVGIPLTEDGEEEKEKEEKEEDLRDLISTKQYWFISIVCGAFLAFYASVESTYGSYIASYSKLEGFENEVTASYLTSAFWGSFCVGRLLSIPIAVFIPPEGFLIGSLVLTVLSVLPLVLFPGKIVTWVVSIAYGLFIAPIWATLWNIMGKYTIVTGVVATILAASSW